MSDEYTEEKPFCCEWSDVKNSEAVSALKAELGLSDRGAAVMDGVYVGVRIDTVGQMLGSDLPEITPAELRALAIYIAELESALADSRSEDAD